MKFEIYGDKVTVNDEMRLKIEERLSFLGKYFMVDEETSARLLVKTYGTSLKVEVTIPTKIALLRGEVVNDNFSNAVDLAIDKIEDQIRRQKSRLSRKHKDSLAESFIEDNENKDVPVKTKTIFADEMDLDEAIMKMEMLGHSFYIYKDIDENKVAVVYKRNDNGYGLIEINE